MKARDPQTGGFTVIELVVASAITVVIATILLGALSSLLGTWARTQGRMSATIRAERVLNQLACDLQGAACYDQGGTWLAATLQASASASGDWVGGGKPAAGSLDPAASDFTQARFGLAGVWLRMFTTEPAGNAKGGPVAVGYQIVRRPSIAGAAGCDYLLCRAEVSAAATWEAGFDLAAPNYLTPSNVDGAAGTLVSPSLRDVLADHVIDFGVRFYAPGWPLRPLFPASATEFDYRAKLPRSTGGANARMPWEVDIMVRVLTDEGARQIAALEDGHLAGDWWTLALAHSQAFTRRELVRSATP